MKARNKNFNIPNTLTLLRIVLIIPFIIYFLNDEIIKAAIVLAVSGVTDMLDGMIARQFNQFTELGQMLDPLSDKLTQGAVAVCFAVKEPLLIPLLAIFVVKEVSMVIGGIYLIRKHKKPGGAKWYGKAATVMFYFSFISIAVLHLMKIQNLCIPVILLSITAAFMIYAFVRYAKIFFAVLHSDDPQYTINIDEIMDKKRANK